MKVKSKVYKAVVVDAKSDTLRVSYTGGDWDPEWLPLNKVQPYKPIQYPIGARVEVKSDKAWYKGKIIDEQLGVHHIRYDNRPEDDDEWVGASSIRVL